MADPKSFSPQVTWIDLTAPDAEKIRDFYTALLGLRPEPVSMGEYDDYNMVNPETGIPVLGVCHKKGPNAALPAQWIVYFTVLDLEDSVSKAVRLGAEIIDGPRSGICVLRDPSGAVTALYQAPPAPDEA